MAEESQVSAFYAHKKILITGGSGFMGKVLIWKLLHSCPELDTIYMLMRSKWGKNSISRKDDIFSSQMFDNLKKDYPEALDKVVLITGDVGEEGIGLSDEDRDTLINEVSIIFHSAAVLKMDLDLRTAVNVNTVGAIRMLDVAAKMKKLEAFVYISTAFCCCENFTVEEKIYPAKHNPYDIINLTQWMEPEFLEKITPQLIHPLPNTYIYSKRLTESLLLDYQSKVPLIVARPSIVIPSHQEPLPGWNDNLNGPGAFFVIGGKGLLRTTMMNGDGKADLVPVDISINAILSLPWANPKEKLLEEISVYNITQTAHKDLTWGKLTKLAVKCFDSYPFDNILWYPSSDPFTKSILVYTIKCIFLHYLPAYIIDFILRIMGEKTFMVRSHDKLRQGERVLRYFTQQKWEFRNDHLLQLDEQLNEVDKKKFIFNMSRQGDVIAYMKNAVLGSKIYIFKEDVKNMDRAKRTANIMYALDRIAFIFKFYILWKIITLVFNMFLSAIEWYQNSF
ncbi:putative fatty acyl-CoA reductase CG5065 [Planococcus citri]|uniref:putative fatty acyl-CoA reductase CG5065 n=1 Tax=Planococcus citri TaxID=170843 RepID=UPI0031F9FF50